MLDEISFLTTLTKGSTNTEETEQLLIQWRVKLKVSFTELLYNLMELLMNRSWICS
jgi:hypothetical protein